MKLKIDEMPKNVRTFSPLNWEKITAKSAPIEENYGLGKPRDKGWPEEIIKIAWRMVKTCLMQDGIGLAAPQIGIFKNIIICRGFEGDGWRYSFAPYYNLYLNPEFKAINYDGKVKEVEHCLSVPGKGFEIERYRSINLSWQEFSKKGQLITLNNKIEGFPARLAQHEFDHLKGISIPQRWEMQQPKVKKKKQKQKVKRKS